MLSDDIEARLWRDAGQCTLGELLQDRTAAALEIRRLRKELSRLASQHRPRAGRETQAEPEPRTPPPRLRSMLRLPEVCRLVGLGRSTIYRRIQQGTFPVPIQFGRRSVGWPVEAIDLWCERLQPSRRAA